MRIFAIDIGGTKFSTALFEDGAMKHRRTEATDREGGREWMMSALETRVPEWRGKVDACGIGFGGPVDFAAQRVALSTHAGGWSDFPLVDVLGRMLAVPAVMDNDANAGALGEANEGAGRKFDPLFYMTLSTGIGGGIVIDGRVYRGADSYAGEIGHTTIQPGGAECLCGARGCFERLCGGLWLERDFGRSARELLEDAQWTAGYADNLARGLKSAIMLLNPARIVIGGGIAKAGDKLFSPLRTALSHRITSWSRARIDVVPAALGDDSVLWGAYHLTRQRFS